MAKLDWEKTKREQSKNRARTCRRPVHLGAGSQRQARGSRRDRLGGDLRSQEAGHLGWAFTSSVKSWSPQAELGLSPLRRGCRLVGLMPSRMYHEALACARTKGGDGSQRHGRSEGPMLKRVYSCRQRQRADQKGARLWFLNPPAFCFSLVPLGRIS